MDNSPEQNSEEYETDGGNNTNDRVFLLSYYEAYKLYFADNDARVCAPTTRAVAQTITMDRSKNAGNWWLRSPGFFSSDALYVDAYGNSSSQGADFPYLCARPALWLDLDSEILLSENLNDSNEHSLADEAIDIGNTITWGMKKDEIEALYGEGEPSYMTMRGLSYYPIMVGKYFGTLSFRFRDDQLVMVLLTIQVSPPDSAEELYDYFEKVMEAKYGDKQGTGDRGDFDPSVMYMFYGVSREIPDTIPYSQWIPDKETGVLLLQNGSDGVGIFYGCAEYLKEYEEKLNLFAGWK